MPKLKSALLNPGSFTLPVEFYYGTRKKFCKRMKKVYNVKLPVAAGRIGECFYLESKGNGDTVIVVWSETDDIPVLVHELTHATFDILNLSGVKFGPDNEEVFAYLLGDLTSQVLDFLSL